MTERYDFGRIAFIIMIIIFFSGFILLLIASLHDAIFVKGLTKSEFLILDDVQYMDDGKVLFRFGDIVIKDSLYKDNFQVNKPYEVVYIKYENAWIEQNGIWIYKDIKGITNDG